MDNESEGLRGVKTFGGDGNEAGLVKKKKGKKSTLGIGASLTPDKEESNNFNVSFLSKVLERVVGNSLHEHIYKHH